MIVLLIRHLSKKNSNFPKKIIFLMPNIATAANVGIDNKKDIFAESNLLKLRILAVVIVIPDLLTPGINDKICIKPIKKTDL